MVDGCEVGREDQRHNGLAARSEPSLREGVLGTGETDGICVFSEPTTYFWDVKAMGSCLCCFDFRCWKKNTPRTTL